MHILAVFQGIDAPRAGSAEAKIDVLTLNQIVSKMHPVQAAPRQSPLRSGCLAACARCTPCRQRRGKVSHQITPQGRPRCTPCRQRRGKGTDDD